jgi:hypothetical protein
MKNVKAIFEAELYFLYYLNNKYITNFPSYELLDEYCHRSKFTLVKVTGLDD